jgi:hypothetical protein
MVEMAKPSQQSGIINKRKHPPSAGVFLCQKEAYMAEIDNFTWYGEKGEPLRFADLPLHEQRVALIASGALLRGGAERHKGKQVTEDEVAEQIS